MGLYTVVWGKSKDPLNNITQTDQNGVVLELPIKDRTKAGITDSFDNIEVNVSTDVLKGSELKVPAAQRS